MVARGRTHEARFRCMAISRSPTRAGVQVRDDRFCTRARQQASRDWTPTRAGAQGSGMTLSRTALAMDAAALGLSAGGAALLLRLRHGAARTPRAYACRIAGTMLVMLGLMLLVFTTAYALATGIGVAPT